MRGYLAPGKRHLPSDLQRRFATLSRGRRTKIAKASSTTLLKADQWARGGTVTSEVVAALEGQLAKLKAPKG